MKQTLLEQALALPRRVSYRTRITDEMMELSLAWGRGEVTYTQAQKAIGKGNSTVYPLLAQGLRLAMEQGVLREKDQGR